MDELVSDLRQSTFSNVRECLESILDYMDMTSFLIMYPDDESIVDSILREDYVSRRSLETIRNHILRYCSSTHN